MRQTYRGGEGSKFISARGFSVMTDSGIKFWLRHKLHSRIKNKDNLHGLSETKEWGKFLAARTAVFSEVMESFWDKTDRDYADCVGVLGLAQFSLLTRAEPDAKVWRRYCSNCFRDLIDDGRLSSHEYRKFWEEKLELFFPYIAQLGENCLQAIKQIDDKELIVMIDRMNECSARLRKPFGHSSSSDNFTHASLKLPNLISR